MGVSRRTIPDGGPSGRRWFAVALALAVGFAVAFGAMLREAEAAPSGEYRFVKVADSAEDNLDPSTFGCATVNDRGDVAFKAGRTARNGANTFPGVYRVNASNGRLVTIAQDRSRFDLLGGSPSMNDRGQVAFAAGLEREDPRTGDEIEKILRGDGRSLTTIASTENRFNFFVFDASVNNDGRVAFAAELDERFGFDEGLFSGRGGAITTHYLASTSQFDGSTGRPSINDRGRIAFDERRDLAQGVFATRGNGGFETIAEATPDGFVGAPTFNNAGTAAFVRGFTDEESGEFVNEVVTGDGGPLTTVADTRGEFGPFTFRSPSLNNAGDVAFLAGINNAQGSAIFVNSTFDGDRVISTGDTLDGAAIQDLVFCEEGLSDTGRLAFVADFEAPDEPDGIRTAVFRATPRP